MAEIQIWDLENGRRDDRGVRVEDLDQVPGAREAFDNLETAVDFLGGQLSLDVPETVLCGIHLGTNLSDAMWWDGRILLGDGNLGAHFSYTGSLSIIAHELSHAVIEKKQFQDNSQSKTLTEHFCDVFGIMTKHWQQLNDVYIPDRWLIGARTRLEEDHGVRNMRSPWRNAKVIGARHWDQIKNSERNVYFDLGVLNRAFALATDAVAQVDSRPTWHTTGSVWLDVFDSLPAGSRHTIPDFAERVCSSSSQEFSDKIIEAFRKVRLIE